jgi:transcriptional regulator with XRE-family HTH domain
MHDKSPPDRAVPVGQQIRALRAARGWSLAELARRAATSAPTIHRYENGWDRFELPTLRKIAAALEARLEVRLVVPRREPAAEPRPTWASLRKLLEPLFWDCDLGERADHPQWVLARVLVFGNRPQVEAARRYFGDDAIRRAIKRRDVDARTREYWKQILTGAGNASEGAQRQSVDGGPAARVGGAS